MNLRKHHPDMVTVFGFRTFDPATCEMEVAPYKATREAVAAMRLAEPLVATGEDVPRDALDDCGRYRRVATGWGALA